MEGGNVEERRGAWPSKVSKEIQDETLVLHRSLVAPDIYYEKRKKREGEKGRT